MNSKLKRAQALHATETAAWERTWLDYAGDLGNAMRSRLGTDRARREHTLLRMLADGTEAEAVRVVAERKAAEIFGSGLPEWEAYIDAFDAATVAQVLHFAGAVYDRHPTDLACSPSGIPAPPQDPTPLVERLLAAFDAAEGDVESMALAHLLRLACEWEYLWQRRLSLSN
jgi:hypothetical protein